MAEERREDQTCTREPYTRAQSEVVSTILMVAVVTIAMTTFGVYYLADQSDRSDDDPRADVHAVVTTDSVEFVHRGGATLATADLSMRLVVNGTDQSLSLSSGTWSGADDTAFESGERWWIQRSTHRNAVVEVWLIHGPSNSVVVNEKRNPTRNASAPNLVPLAG